MKKISESFLEFLEPVFRSMGNPKPKTKEFDSALKLGWTIWNATVKADADKNDKFLKEIEHLVPSFFAPFTEALIERKRKEFGECLFYIGEYEMKLKPDGSFSLYAEARESSAVRAH